MRVCSKRGSWSQPRSSNRFATSISRVSPLNRRRSRRQRRLPRGATSETGYYHATTERISLAHERSSTPMIRLFRFLKPYRWSLVVVFVLVFAQSIANLYLPNLMADIVDNGIVKGDTA